MHKDMQHLHS